MIKFAKTNSPKITVSGPITWEGTGYRPIVMTGIDDSSVGQAISGAGTLNATNRYAAIALEIDTSTNATIATIPRISASRTPRRAYQSTANQAMW